MVAAVERMLYVGETPWHGIGVHLEEEPNSAECIKLAGLDWDVETVPLQTADQKKTAIDKYRVTRRVTDHTILGIVRKNYVPIQNRVAFECFDNVFQGKAKYHTAGSLLGGSKVFMLAKLPEPIVVGKDDAVDRYLLLSNSHDGTSPLTMLFTPVRVVCANTLAIALDKNTNKNDGKLKLSPRVKVPHNASVEFNMKQAERTMGFALKYYEKFGDFANYLNAKLVTTSFVNAAIASVFPANDKGIVTKRQATHREEVERLFVEGKGHTQIAGTAWALVNAFAEYADHDYAAHGAREAADRSYSVLMGGAKGLKNRANKVIYGMLNIAA